MFGDATPVAPASATIGGGSAVGSHGCPELCASRTSPRGQRGSILEGLTVRSSALPPLVERQDAAKRGDLGAQVPRGVQRSDREGVRIHGTLMLLQLSLAEHVDAGDAMGVVAHAKCSESAADVSMHGSCSFTGML